MSSLRKPAVSQSLASLLTRSIHRLTRPQPAPAVVPVAGAMVHAACDARPSSRRATLAGAAVLIGALALSFAIPAQADTKKVRYEEVVRSVLYMPMYVALTPGSSNLDAVLGERGIDTVLLGGAATNVCCESTGRDAMMMDYRSIMVSDALASFTEAEHVAALHNWMLYFGDVLDTAGVIQRLHAGQTAHRSAGQGAQLAAG